VDASPWLRAGPDRADPVAVAENLKLRGPFRSARSLRAGTTTRPRRDRQDDRTRQASLRFGVRNVVESARCANYAAMLTWPSMMVLRRLDGPGTGGDDHASFSRSGCRSRLHGWIPMAVDGTSAPGAKNFPLPASPRKRGPRPAFPAHAPAAPKFTAPAGAQRCACPPLAAGGSGSVSSSRP
jgi:hypothetical protein